MRTPIEALDAACKALGSQQKLADALSASGPRVTQPAINQWRRSGTIPEDRCEPIETAVAIVWPELSDELRHELGSPVRVEELRPDRRWQRDTSGRVIEVTRPITPTPMPEVKVRRLKSRGGRMSGPNYGRRKTDLVRVGE